MHTQTIVATLLALAASTATMAQTQNQGQTPPHNPQAQGDVLRADPSTGPAGPSSNPAASNDVKIPRSENPVQPEPSDRASGGIPPMKPNQQ